MMDKSGWAVARRCHAPCHALCRQSRDKCTCANGWCADGALKSSKRVICKAEILCLRRFARVTNLNDCVTRIPTFFTDTGEPFVHADGEHTSWYAQSLTEPVLTYAVMSSWPVAQHYWLNGLPIGS